jgi:hypothetical protein
MLAVKGHGFSRAAQSRETMRALAAEVKKVSPVRSIVILLLSSLLRGCEREDRPIRQRGPKSKV